MPVLSVALEVPTPARRSGNPPREQNPRRPVATYDSLKDVAAAGGWRDVQTLLTCYQQPDQDTLLAAATDCTNSAAKSAHSAPIPPGAERLTG